MIAWSAEFLIGIPYRDAKSNRHAFPDNIPPKETSWETFFSDWLASWEEKTDTRSDYGVSPITREFLSPLCREELVVRQVLILGLLVGPFFADGAAKLRR